MAGRLDSKRGIQPSGGVDFFGDESMGGFKITNVADPVSAQDVATKSYADALANGLTPKMGVVTASTAALPHGPCVYLAGVLTAATTGTTGAINGKTCALNDRIVVTGEATAAYNGIYTATVLGAVGVKAVWTRATDADAAAELPEGTTVYVTDAASSLVGASYILVSVVVVLGVDALNWSQGAVGLSSSTPQPIGTAAVGNSYDAAHGNHVHAHGNLAGGAFHADAVAGVSAGFLSAAGATVVAATSGTNTGDQTLGSLGAAASGANTDITSLVLDQTGLTIKGATATALTIKPFESLTAPRVLSIVTGDADRQITLTGDTSLTGTNTGDQTSVSGNAGTVTGLTLTGAGLTVTTNAGTIAFTGASKTLTIPLDASVSGTNTGDQTNISGNAATVTTNANLTGDVTSSGNAATIVAAAPTILAYCNIFGYQYVSGGGTYIIDPYKGGFSAQCGTSNTAMKLIVPFACKLNATAMYAKVGTTITGAGGTITFKVQVNGTVNNNLSVVLTATQTTVPTASTGSAITLAAGDEVSVQMVVTGTQSTTIQGVWATLALTKG